MRTKGFAFVVAIMLIVATGAFADVPNYINFQGTLTDSASNPIDGTRSMRFFIYDDSTGGSSIWAEQQDDVPINDGLFRVVLGSDNPLPANIFDGTTKWFTAQIAPDGVELSPRQPLVTVPYSFKTYKADRADYADYASYSDDAGYADEAFEAFWADNANHAYYADTSDYSLESAPDGDWTIDGSDVYHLVGDVGIGTEPLYGVRLHVAGGIIGTYLRAHNDFGLQFSNDNGLVRMVIEDGGNVGIGTASPTEKLDVNGTVKMTGFQLIGSRSAGDVLTSDASGVGTWQSVDEFTIPVDDSLSTTAPLIRMTNLYSGNAGIAFYGKHEYSGNYGYIGSNNYGVYGRHGASGNQGILGLSQYGVYGNSSTGWAGYFIGDVYTNGDVGIGTISPSARLDVIGTVEAQGLKLTTGAVDGYVLTSDASGTGTWQEAAGFSLPIDDSAAVAAPVMNIVNTFDGTSGTGVLGKHDYSGNYGYLASNNYGVFGKHIASDNQGVLGASDWGVYGFSTSGYGGYFVGDVYAGGNVGIGNLSPETDLHVEGTITVDQKIQADDSGGLELATDEGTTRLKIIDNGDVGIGTTSPSAELDVAGTIETQGLKLTTGASNGYVLTSDASGTGTWQASEGFSIPYEDSVSTIYPCFNVRNIFAGSAGLGVRGEHALTGNYGYLGSNAHGAYGKNVASGNYGILGHNLGGVYGYGDGGHAGHFVGTTYISDSLGIGRAIPDYKLHVTGSAYVTTLNTGYGNNELYDMDQHVQTTDDVTFNQVHISDYGTAEAGFHVGGTSVPPYARLIVSGYCGIGITTPQERLDVSGTAHVRGLKVGETGIKFNEIIELTGNTNQYNGNTSIDYPTGFTKTNTRVLDLAIQPAPGVPPTGSWHGPGMMLYGPEVLHYRLDDDDIMIITENESYLLDVPYRILIARVQ